VLLPIEDGKSDTMPSSSSFIAEGELQRSIIEGRDDDGTKSPHFELDRKAVWGLYCMYAIIGIIYGFIQNFIAIPICYYVFGPLEYPNDFTEVTGLDLPSRSSLQQCNIGQAIVTMPWNLKVFYGLFLDQFGFFWNSTQRLDHFWMDRRFGPVGHHGCFVRIIGS
jgi:hypothetical protein